jgi:hypothetical protein
MFTTRRLRRAAERDGLCVLDFLELPVSNGQGRELATGQSAMFGEIAFSDWGLDSFLWLIRTFPAIV